MRRFTRLTNGFSKKVENLEHSVALHFFVYNFITCHMSLRLPPALKAGVTDHVWTFEELVEMIDRSETAQKIEYFQTETLPFGVVGTRVERVALLDRLWIRALLGEKSWKRQAERRLLNLIPPVVTQALEERLEVYERGFEESWRVECSGQPKTKLSCAVFDSN